MQNMTLTRSGFTLPLTSTFCLLVHSSVFETYINSFIFCLLFLRVLISLDRPFLKSERLVTWTKAKDLYIYIFIYFKACISYWNYVLSRSRWQTCLIWFIWSQLMRQIRQCCRPFYHSLWRLTRNTRSSTTNFSQSHAIRFQFFL
jgi:hypothetical protein